VTVDGWANTLDEAANALQVAARVTTPEEAWFVVGGVAAMLKRMAMDLREDAE
jgi:hypothetical protein